MSGSSSVAPTVSVGGSRNSRVRPHVPPTVPASTATARAPCCARRTRARRADRRATSPSALNGSPGSAARSSAPRRRSSGIDTGDHFLVTFLEELGQSPAGPGGQGLHPALPHPEGRGGLDHVEVEVVAEHGCLPLAPGECGQGPPDVLPFGRWGCLGTGPETSPS